MASSSTPVDLYNPGHVLACMGLMEISHILCPHTEGRFGWDSPKETFFELSVSGEKNPLKSVLDFLMEAELIVLTPQEGPSGNFLYSEEFPAPGKDSKGKELAENVMPVVLKQGAHELTISHWIQEDGRETFKLFAGRQIGHKLVAGILQGGSKKAVNQSFRDVYKNLPQETLTDPFNQVVPVGSAFGFDGRGSWDALRIGTSLDEQGILLKVSPLVELLSAVGLENTRPSLLKGNKVRYGVWDEMLPLSLCRLALHAPHTFLPKTQYRLFRSHLGDDKYYKKFFYAEQEEHYEYV